MVEELVSSVQKEVSTRVLSATHAREIAQAPKEMQPQIAKKVIEEGLSTRETEKLVKVIKDEQTPADVKQALLTKPNISSDHAESLSQIRNPAKREILTHSAEKDMITPTELKQIVEEENNPVTKIPVDRAYTPPTIDRLITKVLELAAELQGEVQTSVAKLENVDTFLLKDSLEKLIPKLQAIYAALLAPKSKRGQVVQFKGGGGMQ